MNRATHPSEGSGMVGPCPQPSLGTGGGLTLICPSPEGAGGTYLPLSRGPSQSDLQTFKGLPVNHPGWFIWRRQSPNPVNRISRVQLDLWAARRAFHCRRCTRSDPSPGRWPDGQGSCRLGSRLHLLLVMLGLSFPLSGLQVHWLRCPLGSWHVVRCGETRGIVSWALLSHGGERPWSAVKGLIGTRVSLPWVQILTQINPNHHSLSLNSLCVQRQ